MSISTRHLLNTIHPWIGERVRYILDYADQWAPTYSVTSGFRTLQEQWELAQSPNYRAAAPGCSQHNWGLAVDVKFERDDWQQWYLASARNFGLTSVSGDPVHLQAVPGAEFRRWAQSQRLCPHPSFDPRTYDLSTSLFGQFCTTWTRTKFGVVCLDAEPWPDE